MASLDELVKRDHSIVVEIELPEQIFGLLLARDRRRLVGVETVRLLSRRRRAGRGCRPVGGRLLLGPGHLRRAAAARASGL